MLSAVLPADRCAAAPEIAVYLKESVGNATRIDYGTGNSTVCLFTSVQYYNSIQSTPMKSEVLVTSAADLLLHVIPASVSHHLIKDKMTQTILQI